MENCEAKNFNWNKLKKERIHYAKVDRRLINRLFEIYRDELAIAVMWDPPTERGWIQKPLDISETGSSEVSFWGL